ncbi:peptidase S8 [Sorangium cellulosum]|uniref:Peptidase S8 n=1 Tax=Sorangium cellulosum TaxID=56 RepID=A0A4P2Q4X7_SORCE|nr:S8 family serine peptidase [Sorangium cellulosum]AUX24435.1 peptidase S8 [Sorangium cellulosum]
MGEVLRKIGWIACLLLVALSASHLGCVGEDDPPRAQVDEAVLASVADGAEAPFWVVLAERADLRAAYSIDDWDARGRFVIERLKDVAERSQRGVIGAIRARGATPRPHWIANAVRTSGRRDLVDELARRPEVQAIVSDVAFSIPAPIGGGPGASGTPEWNIARIRADQVWSKLGDGDGIVVGSIDSGVAFEHEALVRQYRGNLGNGVFKHDYNFWDPSRICGPPGSPPCDNNGHGTHTMGTIVGGDGLGPLEQDIGVAPGARWITAKGCESLACSLAALVSSGEWMLAPTDLHGNDPKPSLRPHVINNSWGGPGGDPIFRDIVRAWRAAGMAPVFAIGNAGPACGTAASPGDYPESFGVGATDMMDEIAPFSSRGPAAPIFDRIIKPDATAPGVDVRSSIPGGYAVFSGTSMAAPHVTGTLALLWSVAPDLLGDVQRSFDLIRRTALDRPSFDCGGARDGDPNNTYGDGRIDALRAVLAARPSAGKLVGKVFEAGTGRPLEHATILATRRDDGLTRSTSSDEEGAYTMSLPVDRGHRRETYRLVAKAFGYEPATASVGIEKDETAFRAFRLSPVRRASLTGIVRDDRGRPLAGASVEVLGTPLERVTTDDDGFYRIPGVPADRYRVRVTLDGCHEERTRPVVVRRDTRADFTLGARRDRFGYRCERIPLDWVDATDVLPLVGNDATRSIPLPFSFPLYGRSYDAAHVSTNGFLSFREPDAAPANVPIPDPRAPNAAIYPFWNDLIVDQDSAIKTRVIGAAPHRVFVIEFEDVTFFLDLTMRITFEVKLHERTGEIVFSYLRAPGLGNGGVATLGIEDKRGNDAFQYSFARPVITEGLSIRFEPPRRERRHEHALHAGDGLPVPDATISTPQGAFLAGAVE